MGKRGPKPKGLVPLNVRVPLDHRNLLEALAIEKDTTVSAIVCDWLVSLAEDQEKRRQFDRLVLGIIKDGQT